MSVGPPVVMVHGAFCGGWCFDGFRRPFEAAGYAVSAPDLPGHAAGESPEAVINLSMRDYERALVERIRACPEPPVLVGHSMGGLVCQLAARRTAVAGLILLAPSPPWGQPISTPVEGAAAVGLYGRGLYWLDAVPPDWATCRGFTLDRLPETQARAVFARMVPESGRALFETLNWWLDPTLATWAPSDGVRAPVLVVTGTEDRIHPPSTVRMVAARLGGLYREAPGLSHWTMGEPGADQVAALAVAWLASIGLGAELATA